MVLPAITGGQIRADEAGELLDAVTDVVDHTKAEVANAEREGGSRGRGAGQIGVLIAGGLTAITFASRVPIIKQFLVSGLEIAAGVTRLQFLDNLAGTARDWLKVVHRPGEVERFFQQIETPERLTDLLINNSDDAQVSNEDFKNGLIKLKRMAISANQSAVWDRIEASGAMEDCRDYLSAISRFDNNVQALSKRREGDRMEPFARALSELLGLSDKLHVDRQATLKFVDRYLNSHDVFKPYAEFLEDVRGAHSYPEHEAKNLGVNHRYLEPLYNALKGRVIGAAASRNQSPSLQDSVNSLSQVDPDFHQYTRKVFAVASLIQGRDTDERRTMFDQFWSKLSDFVSKNEDPRLLPQQQAVRHLLQLRHDIHEPLHQRDSEGMRRDSEGMRQVVVKWVENVSYDLDVSDYLNTSTTTTFIASAIKLVGAPEELVRAAARPKREAQETNLDAIYRAVEACQLTTALTPQ